MANVWEQAGINFSGLNIDWFVSTMGQLVVGLLLLVVIGAIGSYWWYRRSQKKLYSKTAQFWEEVEGTPKETDNYPMAELTIPTTSMRVFYIKELDLYIPRSVRKVGFRKYWYFIRRNREIINFAPKNLDEEMKKMNLDYDHTDMRYANENLAELINRNFRSKSVKWWQEYKDVISIVIIVFAFTFGAFFLLGKMGDVVGQIGSLIEQLGPIVETNKELAELVLQMKQGTGAIVVNG